MGYRLEGAPLNDLRGADLISEGMNTGSIQVPADGQPIVMMADLRGDRRRSKDRIGHPRGFAVADAMHTGKRFGSI